MVNKKNKESFIKELARKTDYTQENIRFLLGKVDETIDEMLSDATVDTPSQVSITRSIHFIRRYSAPMHKVNPNTKEPYETDPKFRTKVNLTGTLSAKPVE